MKILGEKIYDLIIVGGGAAGFFTAANLIELVPHADILILEQSKEPLSKVRVSGGGRCNVTHACFDPKELVQFYPRGHKELLGPFHKFACGDTMAWFEDRSVALKIEDDGRVFPASNLSSSIMDALMQCLRLGVKINYREKVKGLSKDKELWSIETIASMYKSKSLLIATGSSPFVWDMLCKIGHTIVSPVPSLFTFNIKDQKINNLMGLSMPDVRLTIPEAKINTSGPILITHWGLSGPAILKASAWGAIALSKLNYNFQIMIDWLPSISEEDITSKKISMSNKSVFANALYNIPSRLWKSLVVDSQIPETKHWADLNRSELQDLISNLKTCKLMVKGKSTFKDEFVTAGGINLKEVDFQQFKSKLVEGLYFAGEVLDIDAITGGFNFQAAWTGGFIVANSVASKY